MYHLWKEKEEEILRDIEPVVTLTKDILHSQRCILEGKMHYLGAVLCHFKTDGEVGDGVANAGDRVETEGDGIVGEYWREPMGAVPVPVGGCETGEVCMVVVMMLVLEQQHYREGEKVVMVFYEGLEQ
ncbi:hypothetical protein HN51_012065 [Arachis hypogaea]